MWPDPELREIRIFLTLAEELHFGHTGERLDMTPSRVSQTIRSLEARVGGKLFHRTSRRVQLTSLGIEFGARVRPVYNEMLAAFEPVSAKTRGPRGILRFGVTINTDRPSVQHLLDRFRRTYPACEVIVEEIDIWEPYGPLRGGNIDILCSWLAVDERDLTVGPVIERCERVLIAGRSHPLANRASVRVRIWPTSG